MTNRDLVLVGASAGGVEALKTLVAGLPSDLPASVLIVLHIPPTGTSVLPMILERAGSMPARHAVDGDPLRPGHILVAPPDRHMVVVDGSVMLSAGPRENGHRPAIDPLFRSGARARGSRVLAVVLSGGLDDGTAGMVAVRGHGGVGLVQDPAEALHSGMPSSAVANAEPDYVLPVAELARALDRLTAQAAPEPVAANGGSDGGDLVGWETGMALLDAGALSREDRPGEPSGMSCPDCGGVLFELDDDPVRFRCRVGHAWSLESLAAQQGLSVESALWMALRSLEERVALSHRVADRMRAQGRMRLVEAYEVRLAESQEAAETIRRVIAQTAAADTHDAQSPPGNGQVQTPEAKRAAR
jgi:two-component system, chemotaxis family, protein-glutamate methylesterase/glutaminase